MEEEGTKITKIDFDPLSKEVVDAAFYIHQTMGPGLLESIYEECFALLLSKRGIPFTLQKQHDIHFEGEKLKRSMQLDMVVDDRIVVELKSIERCSHAQKAQILTYMKMGNYKMGFLINFGEPYFKQAIQRFVL